MAEDKFGAAASAGLRESVPAIHSGSFERLRQLYRQQAPTSAIQSALFSVLSTHAVCKNDLLAESFQLLLLAAVTCPPADAPDLRYQERVMCVILNLLDKFDVPPCTGLLDAYHACQNSHGTIPEFVQAWSCRQFQLSSTEIRLRVRSSSGSETGSMIWDSALVLSSWIIAQPSEKFDGLHVLELGAGTGMAGCVLAQHASLGSLALTDCVPEVLANLRYMCSTNLPAARVHVAELDWRTPHLSELLRDWHAPDLIIGSDVVYDPDIVAPLVETMAMFLSSAAPTVTPRAALLALERRGRSWTIFHDEVMRRGFDVIDRTSEARVALIKEDCPFWCSTRAIYEIRLLELSLPSGASDVRRAETRRDGLAAWASVDDDALTTVRDQQEEPSSVAKQLGELSIAAGSGAHEVAAVSMCANDLIDWLDDNLVTLICEATPLQHHPMLRITCKRFRDLVPLLSHTTTLAPGSRVVVRGLSARTEFNGMFGFLGSWDAGKERHEVRLDNGKGLSLRASNLQAAWGKPQAMASWIDRMTGYRRTIRSEVMVMCIRHVVQDYRTNMYVEPEAFALIQYAAEAHVAQSFAIQHALLQEGLWPESSSGDTPTLTGIDSCVPPAVADAVQHSDCRQLHGPDHRNVSRMALASLPSDGTEWWRPRSAVMENSALIAANIHVHPYWDHSLMDQEADPDYEMSGEEGEDEADSAGNDEEEDREDTAVQGQPSDDSEYWSDYSPSDDDDDEQDVEISGADPRGRDALINKTVGTYASPAAILLYKIVREAIERDVKEEEDERSAGHKRFFRLACAMEIKESCDEDDEEESDYAYELDDDGSDYPRFQLKEGTYAGDIARGLSIRRHRKYLRVDLIIINPRDIKRLAGRGNVHKLSKPVYDEARNAFWIALDEICRTAVLYCEHARRNEISLMDIVYALKFLESKHTLFAFEARERHVRAYTASMHAEMKSA